MGRKQHCSFPAQALLLLYSCPAPSKHLPCSFLADIQLLPSYCPLSTLLCSALILPCSFPALALLLAYSWPNPGLLLAYSWSAPALLQVLPTPV